MRICKKCGRKIPNDKKRCVYCYKRKNMHARKLRGKIEFIILAVSDALAKSSVKRNAEYRYYADLFKDTKKKYRG